MTVERYNINEHPWAPVSERFSATDDATYDGAPDTKAPCNFVGWGATPDEAIEDLLRLWQEHEEACRDGVDNGEPQRHRDGDQDRMQ